MSYMWPQYIEIQHELVAPRSLAEPFSPRLVCQHAYLAGCSARACVDLYMRVRRDVAALACVGGGRCWCPCVCVCVSICWHHFYACMNVFAHGPVEEPRCVCVCARGGGVEDDAVVIELRGVGPWQLLALHACCFLLIPQMTALGQPTHARALSLTRTHAPARTRALSPTLHSRQPHTHAPRTRTHAHILRQVQTALVRRWPVQQRRGYAACGPHSHHARRV